MSNDDTFKLLGDALEEYSSNKSQQITGLLDFVHKYADPGLLVEYLRNLKLRNGKHVEVVFFKVSGKYYTQELVEWIGKDEELLEDAFSRSLYKHLYVPKIRVRLGGMIAVCMNPWPHQFAHPISMMVKDYNPHE